MGKNGEIHFIVDHKSHGRRLDACIGDEIETCSRSYAASLAKSKQVTVDGTFKKPGYRLKIGEMVRVCLPEPETVSFQPENIPIAVLHEDRDIIVIDKAAGMVVHPAPGHYSGTVVNALLHHCPDLQAISGEIRPGIVHRLDKNTSGILIVAKNSTALELLSQQFKSRTVQKKYFALVYGDVREDKGIIDFPVGRHPKDRKKMSIISSNPRNALTLWTVKERFGFATCLELDIKTGRTHQIRVHCSAIHHPVIGDLVYAGKGAKKELTLRNREMGLACESVERQMLHAGELKIRHPRTKSEIRFCAPLHSDMENLVQTFRNNSLST